MTDSTRLDGEVVIVTGAAQGIGGGIANVLAMIPLVNAHYLSDTPITRKTVA